MNKMLRYFYMLLVLMAFFCGTAMAGEIGELVTPTPMPAIETDSGEIGEIDAAAIPPETVIESVGDTGAVTETPKPRTDLEIGEVPMQYAQKDALEYTLFGGVLDASGNWLYATGDAVSWANLPEGSKLGVCMTITNRGMQAVEATVTETVDGTAYDRGAVTVEAGGSYRFWRYYAEKEAAVRAFAYTVNGEEAASADITFVLDGAPAGVEYSISACEMDINGTWVRDFGDTAHRAQIDVGQHWGYVVHVKNTSAQDAVVHMYDSVNGDLYDWGEVTVAAGGGVDLPVKLRGTMEGACKVYVAADGQQVAEAVLNFVQD